MFTPDILTYAENIVRLYTYKKLKLATAESCTGGLVAAAITSVAGSSAMFERGFITYSNEAKCEELGIDPELITAHGAVSEQVASAMAEGARRVAKADVGVAITGIAGPGGGSFEKPVGLVYIALTRSSGTHARCFRFDGFRTDVRRQALVKALEWLQAYAEN